MRLEEKPVDLEPRPAREMGARNPREQGRGPRDQGARAPSRVGQPGAGSRPANAGARPNQGAGAKGGFDNGPRKPAGQPFNNPFAALMDVNKK